MAVVTIKDVEERLEHYRLLNIEVEPYSLDELARTGELALLWVKYGKDEPEVWEILPYFVAKLVLRELPYQGATRARLYSKLPSNAPDDVRLRWLEIKLRRGGACENLEYRRRQDIL